MSYIKQLMVRVRESKNGETMTEYVLIIAAIAVAGYIAYKGLEGGINSIIANVTSTPLGCVRVAPNPASPNQARGRGGGDRVPRRANAERGVQVIDFARGGQPPTAGRAKGWSTPRSGAAHSGRATPVWAPSALSVRQRWE